MRSGLSFGFSFGFGCFVRIFREVIEAETRDGIRERVMDVKLMDQSAAETRNEEKKLCCKDSNRVPQEIQLIFGNQVLELSRLETTK